MLSYATAHTERMPAAAGPLTDAAAGKRAARTPKTHCVIPALAGVPPQIRSAWQYPAWELKQSVTDIWQAARHPAHVQPAAATLSLRTLLRDPEYRRDFTGRMGTQLGQGISNGSYALLLSLDNAMNSRQGLLANCCINAAEMAVGVWASRRRGTSRDHHRKTGKNSVSDAHLTAKRLRAAGKLISLCAVLEVAITAAMMGILYGRGTAILAGKARLYVLAAVRTPRSLLLIFEWSLFDTLKEHVHDAQIREAINTKQQYAVNSTEMSTGHALNFAATIACQLAPTVLGTGPMVGVMAGMMVAGLALSIVAKAQYIPEILAAFRPVASDVDDAHMVELHAQEDSPNPPAAPATASTSQLPYEAKERHT